MLREQHEVVPWRVRLDVRKGCSASEGTEQADQGDGHSPELPGLKNCLGNVLSYKV